MAVFTWGVIGLILGLVGAMIYPDRGLTRWMTGLTVGISFGLLTGWFGAVMFQVGLESIFEPVSTTFATAGAAIAVAVWLAGKFVQRSKELHPELHQPKPLPHLPNGPM